MRALSIRQPYAEEVLLGLKRIEYRSWRVSDELMGTTFYIYAGRKWPKPADIKRFCKRKWKVGELPAAGLPTGVLVGTARISKCVRGPKYFQWYLKDVKRLARPLKPKKQPQPSWFNPF